MSPPIVQRPPVRVPMSPPVTAESVREDDASDVVIAIARLEQGTLQQLGRQADYLESIDNRLKHVNLNITAIGIVFLVWMALKAIFWLRIAGALVD